jgi:sugar lactone lactonase YvrE
VFFTDTPTRRIYTFAYDRTGALSDRRLLWEMPSSLEGGPDGAQCDAQGFLWAAISGAGQVRERGSLRLVLSETREQAER